MNHEPGNPEPAGDAASDLERREGRNHSDFRLSSDDPRLTAYVLGELDEAGRSVVERELAGSESSRRQVDEINCTANLLAAALATEPAGTLSSTQRRTIERNIRQAANSDFGSPLIMILAASVLAVTIGGLGLYWVLGGAATDRAIAFKRAGRADGAYFRLRNTPVDDTAAEADSLEGFGAYTGFSPYGDAKIASSKPVQDQLGGGTSERGGRYTGFVLPKRGRRESVVENIPSRRLEDYGPDQVTNGFDDRGRVFTPADEPFNTESYSRIYENPFLDVRPNPLSTFSIDVDTASYANVRRFLNQHALPPKDAVRIEELVNYFKYGYAPPEGDAPFAVHAEIAGCPWRPEHRLLRIALKGREIDLANRPASNLVFLIDVSGSMDQPDKLPLLKSAMAMLVDQLGENDRVAMVVYAGSSGLVLPATSGQRKAEIRSALEQLQAGGSTNGASGIELAYQVARQNFIRGGTNRVLLATDGDFNVGVTDEGALTRLIEEEAKDGVFLSVLGFGSGNLKDATMEKLADRGNGNYAYIDGPGEARKVLVEQLGGTLVTIAKDVKLQLEFNLAQVAAYRLLGYENRLLQSGDFDDDRKDAGEIGTGHTVTAFYELAPAGGVGPTRPREPLKYQRVVEPTEAGANGETLTLALRYKAPEADESRRMTTVVKDAGRTYAEAGDDFKFAAAVAAFGLVLRDSEFKGNATLAGVLELAQEGRGADDTGYRAEFIELVKKAREIAGQ